MSEERLYFFNWHRGRGRKIMQLYRSAVSRIAAERGLRKSLKAQGFGVKLDLRYTGDA